MYKYFEEFYLCMYPAASGEDIHRAFYADFDAVADAAIDAAESSRIVFALELQQHAHTLLSQAQRNAGGPKRMKELRMNRVIDAAMG